MTDEHKQRTLEMIAVMQAYVDGKPIECSTFTANFHQEPVWDWSTYDYRIVTTPDSINWDHVAPEWNYMARDADGDAFLYCCEPRVRENYSDWGMRGENASPEVIGTLGFSSYARGTVDWKDSLVRRPS